MTVLDFRGQQPNPPQLPVRKHWIRDGKVVERDPAKIDTIVLHQTACVFGRKSTQPDRYHRALGVACHALAFNDGVVALANPFRWYVQHGNGYNDRSLGLEVEGLFPGLVDHPRTLPKMPGQDETPVTPALIEAGRLAIREMIYQAGNEGIRIRRVVAHRQSSPTRRADPGEALWKALVVDYAVRELGLVTDPTETLARKDGRRGRPIPAAWGGPDGVPY